MATNQEKIEALDSAIFTFKLEADRCKSETCGFCIHGKTQAQILQEMLEELQDEELKK